MAFSVISFRVKDGIAPAEVAAKYNALLPSAKVAAIDDYVQETFGQTTTSVGTAAIVTTLAALLITFLVSLLFARLMIVSDRYRLAVLKASGFSRNDLVRQYVYQTIALLILGLATGWLLTKSIGQAAVAAALASLGAAAFRFVSIEPQTVLVCLGALSLAALTAIWIGTRSIATINIAESIKE